MTNLIICPPETKCKDCDISQCSKNLKHLWIATRGNGKSKTSLINYINNSDIKQGLEDELIKQVIEMY